MNFDCQFINGDFLQAIKSPAHWGSGDNKDPLHIEFDVAFELNVPKEVYGVTLVFNGDDVEKA